MTAVEAGGAAPQAVGRERRCRRSLWPFGLWLIVFYVAWLALVGSLDLWREVFDHWPIATAMAVGSYFAGSTPMGGGTVGFPVLVLLFDMPSSAGRNFSLGVQSIGMVSAAIYIFSARLPLAWGVLRWATGTALVSTPLTAAFVAPHLPSTFVAIVFAVIWCSFGILHFLRINDIIRSGRMESAAQLDCPVGIGVGLVGGIASAITGVGIDMVLYTLLVALLRVDIKMAIPTSVVLMAFVSVIGASANLALGTMDSGTFHNLVAAWPVVAVGAPFGAVIVQYLSRQRTLLLVSTLCVVQFIWTLIDKEVVGAHLVLSLLAVGGVSIAFLGLYRLGDRFQGRAWVDGTGEAPRSRFVDRGARAHRNRGDDTA